MTIIVNTTVISNFASVGQLDMLHRLYNAIFISTDVYEEIQAGLSEGYSYYEGIEALVYPITMEGWIHLAGLEGDEELRLFAQIPIQLHAGEASCIAIASQRGWSFLSDDLAARKQARKLGIPISGTLGCLVLAVERDLCQLEDANRWLQQMVDLGFRSPLNDISSLLSPR